MDVEVDERAFAKAGDAQRTKLRAHARRLAADPYLGERVPRARFRKRFRGLTNLFRLELPEGWRALSTIATNPARGGVVRIVWIEDHGSYDRLFGYKRR